MQKHGRTAAGKQRFRCIDCNITGTRKRPDTTKSGWKKRFLSWIISSKHITDLCKDWHCSRMTALRNFDLLWTKKPEPNACIVNSDDILILDATAVVSRETVVCIARTKEYVATWYFTPRESYTSWTTLISLIEGTPAAIVCDGQKGLLKAIFERWPSMPVQRCVIHIHRMATSMLRGSKYQAGQELFVLADALLGIHTIPDSILWKKAFLEWYEKYHDFLKEKAYNPEHKKSWWYIHRKIRSAASLLWNSLPQLFLYLHNPQVPRTSNHLEGGVNSRLKDLFRIHRGISKTKKITLTAWYLKVKQQSKKPTRNVT